MNRSLDVEKSAVAWVEYMVGAHAFLHHCPGVPAKSKQALKKTECTSPMENLRAVDSRLANSAEIFHSPER